MDSEKKTVGIMSAPSTSTSDIGVAEAVPQKVYFGKKLLYHLWDADQHLKSSQVCLIFEISRKNLTH